MRAVADHRQCIPAIALAVAVLPAAPVRAHDFSFTDVLAVLRTDGTYVVDLTVDVDALALGVSPTIDSAELAARLRAMPPAERDAHIERLREMIQRRVRIEFDGREQLPVVSLPHYGTPLAEDGVEPTVLGTLVRLTGRIPPGAETFTFRASRSFQAVHLTVFDQATAAGAKFILSPSEQSPPYRLGEAPAPAGRRDVAARYLILGFEHILPLGLDHILFVLGLFLLSTRFAPLLWQITAFTVAHSVTLALSMYGVVSLPSRLVESLIALSIAYVAIENLFTAQLKPWRPALVFGFGLLHGLGFAGVLRELGLPPEEFVTALITFNLGVELGQLAVVLLALLLVGWCRKKKWYRPVIVQPLSAVIAVVGLWWAFQRAFLGG